MTMESIAFVKRALRIVWDEFINHLELKVNRDRLFAQQLIDDNTMDIISSDKSNKQNANRVFLTHLRTSATIKSLMKFCEILRDTAPQSDHPHVALAKLLGDELKKWKPEAHIEPIRNAPRSNGQGQAMVAGNSVGYSTPHSGHSQPGQISSCQPPSTARQDTSPSDPNYRFAIMVANDNEMNATMHFLGSSEEDGYKVTEDVQSYTYEGDKKLKTEIILDEKPFKSYVPITVGTISGVVVQCGAAGSFTPMGSHRTTLQLVKDAKEGSWELNMIFIVGCCGTRPETVTNVEEQHDSPPAAKRLKPSKGKNKKRKPNNVSNPARSHNKPNKIVPLGTVLVADEIFQYAMGKLEDDGPKWIPKSCFSPPLLEFNTAQRGDDACRIVKKEVATFLSGDFVIKGEVTASELGDLHKNRDYVGFEMEGVGAMKAITDAKIFLPKLPMPEVFLVKGVSDKAGRDKNKEQNLLFFSGKLMKNVKEDSRQQMCTIMSLTLVLRYIIQNITIFKANK